METKPFHEAIVGAVKKIDFGSPGSVGQLRILKDLTMECAIPKNHDAIADAFRARFRQFNEEPAGLFNHLDAEKARHATAAAEKKSA